MFELVTDHFERVDALFTGEHLRQVIDAVSAGNSPGWLWVDDLEQPKSALLWDKTHSIYLVGAADNADFNQAACRLKAEQISEQVEVAKVYASDAGWDDSIEAIFAGAALRKRERVFYRLDRLKISDWRARLPDGFRVSAINEAFEALAGLEHSEWMVEEIESCWTGLSDFRQRGFGFCAHDDAAIVCWCTAEYVSAEKCGIGIETVEAYQGRGFATLTASAFAEHCLKQGIAAHWDAWAANIPSVAVAERVGFRKIEDYRISFAEFKAKRMV